MKTARIDIPAGDASLKGDLAIPDKALGIVLFAHGSGSSRLSPRNRQVAEVLRKAGLATLLMDLLTREEEDIDMYTAHLRFDIPFLAERLTYATEYVLERPDMKGLQMGYFGASTGAAAALMAAAGRPGDIYAIVSRGGRPDLAGPALARVKAPTLLIVGGKDKEVIELTKEAMKKIPAEKEMIIVPGATHLFEEPGKIEEVAAHASSWFARHLIKNG